MGQPNAGLFNAAKRIARRSLVVPLVLAWGLSLYRHFYHHYYRLIVKKRLDYWDCQILRGDEGNDLIAELLESPEAVAIGKIGNVEGNAIGKLIERGGDTAPWGDVTKSQLHRNAGVFPPDDEVIHAWCLVYADSLKSLDLIGLWYHNFESRIVKSFAPNAKLANWTCLLWHQHENPWTRCLKDKRVLVIHPFEQTITKQFLCRDRIWQDERCLPCFELDTIRVPLSDALAKSGFKNWFDALESMKTEIAEKDFDVALIGAGAWSIPLAAYVKKMGKKGIHLGGETQILFGIRGTRWDHHPAYTHFFNSHWCRPSEEETPVNVSVVEGGCYW